MTFFYIYDSFKWSFLKNQIRKIAFMSVKNRYKLWHSLTKKRLSNFLKILENKKSIYLRTKKKLPKIIFKPLDIYLTFSEY